jgi:hypothetical protein
MKQTTPTIHTISYRKTARGELRVITYWKFDVCTSDNNRMKSVSVQLLIVTKLVPNYRTILTKKVCHKLDALDKQKIRAEKIAFEKHFFKNTIIVSAVLRNRRTVQVLTQKYRMIDEKSRKHIQGLIRITRILCVVCTRFFPKHKTYSIN